LRANYRIQGNPCFTSPDFPHIKDRRMVSESSNGVGEAVGKPVLPPPALGVSRNACKLPLSNPVPTICPVSLMEADIKNQPLLPELAC